MVRHRVGEFVHKARELIDIASVSRFEDRLPETVVNRIKPVDFGIAPADQGGAG